jgi:hypothetical protein
MDFEREMANIATIVEPPEQKISGEALTIATESLHAIDLKYGPNSDNPLPFHNAEHSVAVTRRVIRFINILYPYMKPRQRSGIYDLGAIGGPNHDFEQGLGVAENEKASGGQAVQRVAESGGATINTDTFKKRLLGGIQATTVQMEDDGDIVQVNVQKGSHDPFKFAMAFSDINGIAMEGSRRMFNDATRLCYEIYGEPTLDQLYNFLVSQASFLRKRLNDHRVKSDIAYYFPNEVEDVYHDMRKAFRSNILSAYGMAVILGERPELKSSVGVAVRSIDVVDKSILGDLISKTLHRKLSN